MAAAAKVARHRQHVVVVETALDHHVHLDRREAGSRSGIDARQHAADRIVRVVHAAEEGVVECVEAHRDAIQPRLAQAPRHLAEQHAVGGQRQFESADCRELGDELVDILAQQRFAAGDADLLHAARLEQAGEAGDFLETQQFRSRQKGVVVAEATARHAIHAAEVAAIGDRDTHVAQRALVRVEQRAGRGGGQFRQRGSSVQGNDLHGSSNPDTSRKRN